MATKRTPRRRVAKRPARARPQRRRPETLRLRSLSASLTVNDLERSIAWYRDLLRFTVGERWEEGGKLRGIQLKAGTCDLMLTQDDFAKGRDRKKGEGFRLWISTVQDIDVIAARVKAAGWPLDREPSQTPWGDYAFAVSDPDGFKITVIREP